ncbi:ABC transporter permease [Kibdelosporangium philippinense]|uniref:ABC transporter permease n=1 Tax=Kibdelosporangium philippinense TaxID=211113 RepID=UPI00361F94A2
MIGGTIGVMVGMSVFTGTVVGLQGFSALNQVGTSAFAGVPVGLLQHAGNRAARRRARIVGDRGRGFTAQLGAMRISRRSTRWRRWVSPVCRTCHVRVIAGFIAIIPLYVIGC